MSAEELSQEDPDKKSVVIFGRGTADDAEALKGFLGTRQANAIRFNPDPLDLPADLRFLTQVEANAALIKEAAGSHLAAAVVMPRLVEINLESEPIERLATEALRTLETLILFRATMNDLLKNHGRFIVAYRETPETGGYGVSRAGVAYQRALLQQMNTQLGPPWAQGFLLTPDQPGGESYSMSLARLADRCLQPQALRVGEK